MALSWYVLGLIMSFNIFATTEKENMNSSNNIHTIVQIWQSYLDTVSDWRQLINGITAKECGCGMVYELANPLLRATESFAIADMSNLAFSEPHYHPETEIYFILQGSGLIVIGGQEQQVQKDSVILIPSNIAHFTIPENDLVIAVINTPPFNAANYYPLTQENSAVKFDKAQFERLIE